MSTFNLTLLQNSYSFVNEALAKALLAEKDSRHWQFAIFALVQAIELALKERLRREHQALIFKNVDDPKQTVTLDQAASRLKLIAKIEITESDRAAIRTAIQWRNTVVHYEFEFSTDDLKPVFAKLLGFLTEFYLAQLGLSLADHVQGDNWDEAVSIGEYGKELFIRAKSRFATEKIDPKFIWLCPRCGNGAFVIQDQIDTCYVCNYEEQVVECDSCNDYFFESDMHDVMELESRNREVRKSYCAECYERHQRWLDELHYDDL